MQLLFGGLISVVLLGIFVRLGRVAINFVNCVSVSGCTRYSAGYFNEGMAQALAVIGGLVSALVIADLAMAKPGNRAASSRAQRGALCREDEVISDGRMECMRRVQ